MFRRKPPVTNPEIDAWMERLRREHKDDYVATLERELRERLLVNVGLLAENRQLKQAKKI